MSFSVAARAFFAALTRKDVSDRIEAALKGDSSTENRSEKLEGSGKSNRISDAKIGSGVGVGSKSERSTEVQPSALALLAALQREARFVDFVKEPLDGCDEATLGAAARTVRDRCATVLERFFEIRPLTGVDEGSEISVDADEARNSARIRVSSSRVGVEGGVSGRLAHSGWIAKKCATPSWSGTVEDAFVLAPIEIDVE